MAPKSPLCPSHRKWADPKMRPLLEARYEDARRGGPGKSYSDLLDYYMQEYEKMPFAKSDFIEYLGPDGKPLYQDWELRKMARRYFHNHSDPNKLATLEAFESAGGQSEPHPERALCASEIWAAGQKDHIQALTCAELEVDPDAPAAKGPNGWLGARKTVVKREFSMLPETEQARWEEEAQAQRAANKSRRAQPIAVQQRQKQFFGDLTSFIKKRMARGGLGEHFVVVYQGFFVDPVAYRLSRFRGQQESFAVPKWHLSPGYDASYNRWISYMEPLVKGLINKDLPPLSDGAAGAELLPFRGHLREHLEILFKLSCALQQPLDEATFWAEVAADPANFVDPARLPAGTRFRNPDSMPEHDFVFIYQHIFECYWSPETVDEDKRFLYEQVAIHRFAGAERARLVQASSTAPLAVQSATNASSVEETGPPTGDASTGRTSPGSTFTGGASTGGASSEAASPTSTRATSPASGVGSPPTGSKRKLAPDDSNTSGTRSMAEERYITRNVESRRSPPPKKLKASNEKGTTGKGKGKTAGKAPGNKKAPGDKKVKRPTARRK